MKVHLFHIDLPDNYENIINQIYNLRLETQQALELRKLEMMKENNEYLKAKIDLEADIAVKMIDIRRQIDNAILNRTGAITKVVTEAKVLQKTVIRERDLKLI